MRSSGSEKLPIASEVGEVDAPGTGSSRRSSMRSARGSSVHLLGAVPRLIAMRTSSLLVVALFLAACDGGGTSADRAGVAAECVETLDCALYELPDAEPMRLTCLTEFKGGYCGIEGCQTSLECPEGSICVAHTDAANYCFRVCSDKSECNRHRSLENEANCSSNFDWANPADDDGAKACIPPSGS
jgi:hypothetical protein